MNNIKIIGASQNNLKNIDVNVPKHLITVFTGRSGSGKSSLVFNTIAAESEQLLNESYSSYIQFHLNQQPKPKVKEIKNLPVAMTISQKRFNGNSRSTVGTVSDIYASVRLLWSRVGEPFVGYSDAFSFNSPNGMCETCEGLGYIEDINLNELLDWDKSLNEGAIDFPSFGPDKERGKAYRDSGLFDNDKKLKDYTKEELDLFLYQEPIKLKNPPEEWRKSAKYVGLILRFRRIFLGDKEFNKKRYAKHLKNVVENKVCPTCNGQRLNSKILSCKILDKNISDFTQMTIKENLEFLTKLNDPTAKFIIEPLRKQLEALEYIGLSYLTLNRVTTSLSGGEAQRLKLIRHLNSPLSDLIYIIDEPSVGLHPEDISKINEILKSLKEKGNTILIVEHDPDVIKESDYIIDMGPGSGKEGGVVTFEGTYKELLSSDTATGQALRVNHHLKKEIRKPKDFYQIGPINKNNLFNVKVDIPKQVLTVLTGVAGSGKSSLVKAGFINYNNAIFIDQKSVQGSNRSNLLTYLGVFDRIRTFFSKETGLSKSMFSYNSKGACPNCGGKGYIETELAFMGEFSQPCEVCHGKRYRPEVLNATVNGYSIADFLELTVDDGIRFFDKESDIKAKLQAISKTGLNYITLGQPLSTLSGGEIQRVKLGQYLNEEVNDSIFIFDEPTTGLHETDIPVLMNCFNDLIEQNNTVILIEHNLSIMCEADWIIDVGPGPGLDGGKVQFSGTPMDFVDFKETLTSKHLKRYLVDY
ncbi:ATP-binding cassette domain-containing protein [Staphylococcus epidermidis]|uniref:ATP-binding cassette domain-containing protein n=1 Tax=Staphylococcus epidermidis TaxID=1282 RepID=UPI00026C0FD7|nr:excinuclease ABC subunit UvrA [Staphylococcus epidermidis]EJD91779.1 putative excinuclease ABC, A subunit [Staphylococcus epidermidis NIHLM057]EJD93577.1 putative excinuclease ABC, A subunit [Staphylococcus epidermidis NIHLM053]MCG1059924.1 excinuclease ABC subunit UvrA [Staphylococcus epidermidis]MCG1080706.1 excinuclease ABC subunit UvrA [Staphylococcus epidermidis]MCG1278816.1 excinuclease ABC subunit UvrA [Staphylococcus epidermidis]